MFNEVCLERNKMGKNPFLKTPLDHCEFVIQLRQPNKTEKVIVYRYFTVFYTFENYDKFLVVLIWFGVGNEIPVNDFAEIINLFIKF